MDLSDIYSKTPKGLRARASLIGGLSSHLMKVLTHVDGNARAETILLKFDKLTPQQLSADLTRLEQEGYIRLATVTSATDDSWALTVNFEPMVVEEYQSEEELEVSARAKTAEQTRKTEQQQAEQKAIQDEERRAATQLKADIKAEKLREKEKIKAETKVKAQLEQEQREQENQEKQRLELERIALETARKETARQEAEASLKAQQEAERIEQQRAVERAGKLAEEMARKAALKAREAAEQAEVDAEEKAKQQAHREIERISREAEEAQKKSEAEAKARQEAERLEALNIAKAAEDARQAELEAEHQAQLAQAQQAAIEQEKIEAAAQVAEMERLKQVEAIAQESALKEKLAQEEKERARLEIAAVLRKAEDDRKIAVAQAKAEKLEVKRQARAEQEARVQAERKIKEEAKELAKQQKLKTQAEEQAKTEALDQARREAARIAKEAEIAHENALENERLQAQQAAEALAAQAEIARGKLAENKNQEQIDVEAARTQLIADEQANLAAKHNAQLEMERIGREAELVRQKFTQQEKISVLQNTTQNTDQKTAQKTIVQKDTKEQPETPTHTHLPEFEKSLPNDALLNVEELEDFDVTEAAEEAAFEAEEQAAEAKSSSIETTVKHATVGNVTAGIKNAAKSEAAAMASVDSKSQPFVSVKKIRQWLGLISKMAFIYVPVLLLLLVLLLHFINLTSLIEPIEKIASDSIGGAVKIKKVHASLWPQPHLVLEDVVAGDNRIEAVHVLPATTSLFDEVKVVKSLVIEGLNIEQANFGQPLQWASNVSKAKNLKVEQINLNNLTLAIRDLKLETFDGKITLSDTGALSSIELVSSDNALSVKISPSGDTQNNESTLVLNATNWKLPFNQKIVFGALSAKGIASQYKINFSQIEAEIFGGSMTGQAAIEWPHNAGEWLSSGEYKLSNANVEDLLKNFGSAITIEGKLALDARFYGKAREASKLADSTISNANFEVRQGVIEDIELARGVLSSGRQSLAGEDTEFDKLTGSVKFNQNQYQFGKLVLTSSQFNASGYININANQTLTGRINADLLAQSRRLKANFGITGRGEDLKSN